MSSTAVGLEGCISAEAAAEIDAVFSVYDDGNEDGCIKREKLNESKVVRITYIPRGKACRAVFEISIGYPDQTPIRYYIELLSSSPENKLLLSGIIQEMNTLRDERAETGDGALFDLIEIVKRFEDVRKDAERCTCQPCPCSGRAHHRGHAGVR